MEAIRLYEQGASVTLDPRGVSLNHFPLKCPQEPLITKSGFSNPPLRLGVHGVSKLALREGASVRLEG